MTALETATQFMNQRNGRLVKLNGTKVVSVMKSPPDESGRFEIEDTVWRFGIPVLHVQSECRLKVPV
jgi:hypothetical protein